MALIAVMLSKIVSVRRAGVTPTPVVLPGIVLRVGRDAATSYAAHVISSNRSIIFCVPGWGAFGARGSARKGRERPSRRSFRRTGPFASADAAGVSAVRETPPCVLRLILMPNVAHRQCGAVSPIWVSDFRASRLAGRHRPRYVYIICRRRMLHLAVNSRLTG